MLFYASLYGYSTFYTLLVGPDVVKFKLTLDVSSSTKERKYTFYRDGTTLQSYNPLGEEGTFAEYYYLDKTPKGDIHTYQLETCYRNNSNEDWSCSTQSKDINSSLLNGTVDFDITINGTWDIKELKLVDDVNVTIKDAHLQNNGSILCDTNYRGSINVDNTVFTDVSLTALLSMDTPPQHKVSITNSTFETKDVTYTPLLRSINLQKFSHNSGIVYISANDISEFSSNNLKDKSLYLTGSNAGFSFENNIFTRCNVELQSNGRIDIKQNNFLAYYSVDDDYYYYSSLSVVSDTQYRSSLYVSENNSTSYFNLRAPYVYANENNLSSLTVSNVEDGTINNNLLDELDVHYSSNVEIKQNTLGSDAVYIALDVYEDSRLNITENNISCSSTKSNDYGLRARALDDSIISKNIIDGEHCSNSVRFADNGLSGSYNIPFSNNTIYDNVFTTTGAAKLSGCLQNNTIYNNIFSGEANYDLWIESSIECNGTVASNNWNTTKQVGPNIVGGPMIGGNYWKVRSAMSSDKDGDGFLDSPISLYIHADSNTTIYDNLALSYNPLTLSSALSNPTEGIWSQATGIMKVLHFKLKNSPLSDFNALITSLEFQFTGSSDASADDIESVTLYDDPKCSMDENALALGSQTFSNDLATFATNITLNQGSERCFYLEYKIKDAIVAKIAQQLSTESAEEYCPCALYGAKLNAEDIKATANGISTKFVGEVEGSINAGWPTISYKDSDMKEVLTDKNTLLPSPLEVMLSDFKSSCVNQWQAEYTITSVPEGAQGYELVSDNIHANTITTNFINGIAGVNFQAGDKSGDYVISVKPKPLTQNCPDATTVPSLRFTVSIGGVKLLADLDGSDGGSDDMSISTFITTIEAKNLFSAEVELPDWAGDAKEVRFEPSWTSAVTDSTPPFNAEFDMASLKEGATMKVTAVAQDDQQFSQVYMFNAIVLPTWVETFNGAPYKGITWKFSPAIKSYELAFSFPDDFIWKNPIPDDIALIGGEENEQGLSITATAFYNIDRTSAFTGSGAFSGELFGKPIEVKGFMKTEFDEQFSIKASPAPYANFSAKIEFDLGSKTLASKTIIVYGVPITVAVDVGGNVEVFADGKLVFSQTLKIDKATFIPGSTITITIDASASAVFGLAKVGIKAEPQGTVQIKLSYTTATAKVAQEQFGGAFSVPVTIYGSLFWGTVSGDLGSTEFGPWKFGDDVSTSMPQRVSVFTTSGDKKFYSTSASTSNTAGDILHVYTIDTSTSATEINPEVSSSLGQITSNNLWEIDPDVTYLNGTNALAIWTSNNGDKTLNDLGDILNHQDIAASVYINGSWDTPQLLISDTFADGTPKVAYESSSNKALAIWTHNASQNITSITDAKTSFELYYALYDETTNSWNDAAVIATTQDTSFDFAPALSSLENGTFMAVWVKDNDGKLFEKLGSMSGGTDVNKSNSDCNVVSSIYNTANNTWSTPQQVSLDNTQTELMPTVGANGDNIVAVWIAKELDNTQVLYMSQYISGNWSTPKELDRASYVIEDPSVIVDNNNNAHIFYRRMDGSEEGLYELIEPLSTLRTFADTNSSMKKIADGTVMWNAPALDTQGNIHLSWTNPNNVQTSAQATINASPIAEFNATINTQGIDENNGRFRYLQLQTGVTLQQAGEFALSASLISPQGAFIEHVTTPKQSLLSGSFTMTLSFEGTKINASGENGIYTLKDIHLLSYTPDAIISDTIASASTIDINIDNFALALLQLDDDNYHEGKPMLITLSDTNLSAPYVNVKSSSGGDITVTLENNTTSFTKELLLESSGLTLQNGSIITVSYIDKDANTWVQSAVWIELPTPDYTLNIPSGWSLISPPVISASNVADIFANVNIVWAYNNGIWSAWSPDAAIERSLQNDGIRTLSQIEVGHGYYVHSDTAHSVSMFSSEWDISELSLSSGWNLIGFSKDVTPESLLGISYDIDRVWCLVDEKWQGITLDPQLNQNIQNKGFELVSQINKAQACFVHVK